MTSMSSLQWIFVVRAVLRGFGRASNRKTMQTELLTEQIYRTRAWNGCMLLVATVVARGRFVQYSRMLLLAAAIIKVKVEQVHSERLRFKTNPSGYMIFFLILALGAKIQVLILQY